MKKQTKLTNFLIITFIGWVLTYIGFAFVLNDFDSMAWKQGSRLGMMVPYVFEAGMTALGIYGD